MNLFVKSGPHDLNRQDEPKIERESQKRITSPIAAAVSIKKARMANAFTFVNNVSENQSPMKCRIDQVNQMCKLLNTMGAKCFDSTRSHFLRLRFH